MSRLPSPLRATGVASRIAILSSLAALAAAPAHASTVTPMSTRERIARADLIVDARVTATQTRLSSIVTADDVELPHTFVTLEVLHTFKGEAPADGHLTLRFEGGADGRGRVLSVSGVPSFQPGDRDILFIHGNGTAMCPLVGFEQGRLRVVADELFNEQGQELWIAPSGDFLFGDARLDLSTFPYQRLPELDRLTDGESARFTPPAASLRPDASAFRAILDLAVNTAYADGAMLPPPAITSVDPGQAFRVRALLAVAPPEDRQPVGEAAPRGQPDEREAELIRKSKAK